MAEAPKMTKREAVEGETEQGVLERRVIRSQYLAIKNVIFDKKDDIIMITESDKFNAIMNEVENLHRHVQKPREQVADAEALLDLANTLVTFSKSHANGVTPTEFVTALLRNFGLTNAMENVYGGPNAVSWAAVGFAVSQGFKTAAGCSTMTGPMKTKVKERTSIVRRRMTRPTMSTRPEELATNEAEEKSGTDKNMLTMFDILRKKRSVRLESLVLNRASFAQTIENIFSLSFLVKDGRAEITMNDSGHHLVSPRNAPAASAISSGEVRYHHFVFRFDFEDWKLMSEAVGVGEELMPRRCSTNTTTGNSEAPTTPIRKLCRNRGLVVQEHSIGNCSQAEKKVACGDESDYPRPRKRRLFYD